MNALCNEILAAINRNVRIRSAWDAGVQEYVLELLETLDERIRYEGRNPANYDELKQWLLNGAHSWRHYSWSGCSLAYDAEIAERLCTPSELKKTRNGERKPNAREEWLDVQARALAQASMHIRFSYVYAVPAAIKCVNN